MNGLPFIIYNVKRESRLRGRIGVRTRIVLESIFLIGKGVLEGLTGIHIDRVLPFGGAVIVAHVDVLLRAVADSIVQNDITCCPATRFKPGLGCSGTGSIDALSLSLIHI